MTSPCPVMASLNQHMHMLDRNESREKSLRREHPLSDFREEAIRAMHDEVGYEFLVSLIESRAPAVLAVLLASCDCGAMDRTGLDQELARYGITKAIESWLRNEQERLREQFIDREMSR